MLEIGRRTGQWLSTVAFPHGVARFVVCDVGPLVGVALRGHPSVWDSSAVAGCL